MIYVVIAYRWGWTNNHQYIVTATADREAAIAKADNEREYRGGKYSCAVYEVEHKDGDDDCQRKMVHWAYGKQAEESGPVLNPRIEAQKEIGNMIAVAMEKPEGIDLWQGIGERYNHCLEKWEAIAKASKR